MTESVYTTIYVPHKDIYGEYRRFEPRRQMFAFHSLELAKEYCGDPSEWNNTENEFRWTNGKSHILVLNVYDDLSFIKMLDRKQELLVAVNKLKDSGLTTKELELLGISVPVA